MGVLPLLVALVAVLAGLGSVANASEPANPAGVSCNALPNGDGSTVMAVGRGSLDGPIHVRRSQESGGSRWLTSRSSSESLVLNLAGEPDGLFVRYRSAGQVYDVPCRDRRVRCTLDFVQIVQEPTGFFDVVVDNVDPTEDVILLADGELIDSSNMPYTNLNGVPNTYFSINRTTTSTPRVAYEIQIAGIPESRTPCGSIGQDVVAPVDVTCEYFSTGQAHVLILSGPDGLALQIRAVTGAGSRWVQTAFPGENPSLDDDREYFARYRQSGQVFETPCVEQPF